MMLEPVGPLSVQAGAVGSIRVGLGTGRTRADFEVSGVALSSRLADRDDGLRGIEVEDPGESVLFFGRPT